MVTSTLGDNVQSAHATTFYVAMGSPQFGIIRRIQHHHGQLAVYNVTFRVIGHGRQNGGRSRQSRIASGHGSPDPGTEARLPGGAPGKCIFNTEDNSEQAFLVR